LAFTPDGRELVSAAFRRGPEGLFVEVSSWDTASGEPSRWFTCRAAVEAIAFSADCERVAWASRDEIAIWDVRGQKPIRTIRRDGQFERRIERGLAFSPAGKTVSCLTYRAAKLSRA
jgi:WD40 repeat protein